MSNNLTMKLTQLKPKKINLTYLDEALKYNRSLKKFNIDITTLIKSISSLLAIKDFSNGNGNSKNHLNNMLIDLLKFKNEFYISKNAFKVFENYQPFHNFTFNEDIINKLNTIYKGYIIPIENISNNLLTSHLDQTQIFKFLINLKNEIIVLKEEKQYIENLSNNQIYSINESYKNLEIYKNIKLSSNTIKLVRNIKNNF